MIKYENFFLAVNSVVTVIIFLLLFYYGEYNSLHKILFTEISYAISPYTATKSITIPIFILYNAYLLLFSCVLYFRLHNQYAKLGAEFLSLSALSGSALLLFPMAPPGGMQTFSGIMHIVIGLYMMMTIVIALWLLASSFKTNKNLAWLSTDSKKISIVIAFMGVVTGIFAVFHLSLFVGLFEKFPIAAFLLWIVMTGVGMLKSDKRIKYIFIETRRKGV